MADPNLVTTYTFNGQEYLFKMSVLNGNLEVLVTAKNTGEEWQCSYDATYIENLTQKTGNFKQFEIFVAMLKSGLLRTSESVSLDLLTFDDLELLRSRKITKSVGPASTNRRYLILTYVVEFDKIRYPLPLEYCGPPDPIILQATIRRLEVELSKAKDELAKKKNDTCDTRKTYILQKKVDELMDENKSLQQEVRHLTSCLSKKNRVVHLQKAVSNLEKSVVIERNSHHDLVERLRQDKIQLAKQLEKLKCSERSLKSKLTQVLSHSSRIGTGDHCRKTSNHSVRTMYKRPELDLRMGRSRERKSNKTTLRSSSKKRDTISRTSSSSSGNIKFLDPEGLSRPATPNLTPRVTNSINMKSCCSSGDNSSRASSRASSRRSTHRNHRLDYKKLEEKVEHLQKMLKGKSDINN